MDEILLINGPLNGRMKADMGGAYVSARIYQNGKPIVGEKVGVAVYEVSPDREMAFWSHNFWSGELMEAANV